MTEIEAIKLFKCLADKSRMQILKSLIQEDMYVERLAERLNLTPATISFHLKKLEDAGAVTSHKDQYYTVYAIKKELFMEKILDIISEESPEAQKQAVREEQYRRKVINSFMEYGRLKAIPMQRKKERIILEEIAKDIQEGITYSEKEITDIITKYHEDYCTIRRDMISERILERQGSTYRKCPPTGL